MGRTERDARLAKVARTLSIKELKVFERIGQLLDSDEPIDAEFTTVPVIEHEAQDG